MRWICALMGAALLFAPGLAAAEPPRLAQASSVLPPEEIIAAVRSMRLRPITEPRWRGDHYVLRAVNRRGEEMRVLVDARRGEVLEAVPVVSASVGRYYEEDRRSGSARVVRTRPPEFDDEITGSLPPRNPPRVIAAPDTPLPRPRPIVNLAGTQPGGAQTSAAPEPQAAKPDAKGGAFPPASILE